MTDFENLLKRGAKLEETETTEEATDLLLDDPKKLMAALKKKYGEDVGKSEREVAGRLLAEKASDIFLGNDGGICMLAIAHLLKKLVAMNAHSIEPDDIVAGVCNEMNLIILLDYAGAFDE